MVFSDEDNIWIRNLYQLKGYEVMELTNKFPYKWWTKCGIKRLLIKYRDTSAVNRLTGSGGPRSARNEENVDLVNNSVVNQVQFLVRDIYFGM